MNFSNQIAKQFREVHFGGNWTSVNLKETLSDVTWEEATRKIDSFNTIAVLVFHINYYVSAVLKVLQGEPLNASDKYSFNLDPILNAEDWERLLLKIWKESELFASLIEQLPDERLLEDLSENKYGNYYRNLTGIIEHTHYHLGQIVLLKRMIRNREK